VAERSNPEIEEGQIEQEPAAKDLTIDDDGSYRLLRLTRSAYLTIAGKATA
jgi:hypothetical protein